MHLSEHHTDAGLQEAYGVLLTETSCLSHRTKGKKEEVQHAAMIIVPQERPRPGRRRLSMHHLSLSLTRFLVLMTMILSVLCKPIKAVGLPDSQSCAIKGHFVDGRITFDQNRVPQPALHRRAEDPESTETASTTATAEAAQASSPDSPTTTLSLPRAFDGGFGTNYTQRSCPTFLRSMVNNDTFISCVPFSLLLQVCPSTRRTHPLKAFPQ